MGASDEPEARDDGYWDISVAHDPDFSVVRYRRVPEDLAQKLLVHGTSDQEFQDGYEAARALRRFSGDTVWTNE